MKSLSIISSIALLISAVVAQEGATVPTTGTAGASTYSCDPNTCKIANNCFCASQSPPGGLSPSDTPQVAYTHYTTAIDNEQLIHSLNLVCYSNF